MLQLLALFTPEPYLQESVTRITSTYNICFNKIFVLSVEGKEELLCTFNIEKNLDIQPLSGAILLHRKKETNTLYTINSLNTIIRSENGGQLDTKYQINWNKYKNSVILTVGGQIKVFPTKIYKIISL